MNDIEQRIKQLLNESVDAQLGPRRPAPPFEPRRVKRLRRFRPWVAPLVTAASVAALVGGAIGVAHVASSGQHPQPGRSVSPPTPAPTTAPTGPNGTSAPTESPRNSASNLPTSQPSAASVTVPPNLDAWILSRPHPQLPTPCPGGFVLYKAPLTAHLTGSSVPDTVASVNCSDTTVGANAEIDVYGAIHGEYGLIYRVPLPADRPGLQFSSGDTSVSGTVLTVKIAGYVETSTQHDPMCCPTTVWQQNYTFTGTTVSQRPLVQVGSLSASGRWTDSHLVITAHSLGAVVRGMTLAQAETAAGTSLSMIGDSIFRPTDHTITGATTLQFSWGVTCFDAARSTSGPGTTVTTSAGVGLGDPMSQIAAAYGSTAKPFTADPTWTGAGNIPAGIIVQQGDGVLLFVGSSPDHRGGTITSIRAAADAFHASSVFC